MRPERLELEGFTTFRSRTVVDLVGADLFALAGATGSGKTSILDAICFALYGSVPRLDDLRLVGPVVSAGKLEAKVRLDFTLGGVAHTATRVVRRDAKGKASTKEARLERGEDVLASDADAVTKAVERLLGLSFGEFCRCVVLPQGAFARFLHDKPKDRGDLLVGLLGAQVYGEVRDRAVDRQRGALARAAALDAAVAAAPTGADVVAVQRRLAAVTTAADEVRSAAPALAALAEQAAEAGRRADAASRSAALLRSLALPAGVAELAAAIASATAAAEAAEREEDLAGESVVKAEAALGAAGDRRLVQAGIAAHEELAGVVAARPSLAGALATAQEQASAAAAAAGEAAARVEALRQAAAAYAVVPALRVGRDCPVCRQPVRELPHHDEPADWRAAAEAAQGADAESSAAAAAAVLVGERLADHDRRIADATARVDAAGPRPALDAALLALDAAERALDQARADERAVRQRAKRGREALTSARQAEARARQGLDAARDGVAQLGAPPLAREDLAADWEALLTWAGRQAPVHEEELRASTDAGARAEQARDAEEARLRACLGAAGAEVEPGRSLGEAAASALAAATAEGQRVANLFAAAEQARSRQEVEREAAAVAGTLATHLKADRFERWLLDEAVGELLIGATTVLHDLSGGAYSLELDAKREFAVVDHRNADERRPVRTLSGGETFLASLALALSLAERVALLAPGQVRLESLFLDEGFGTLDPEALDTVASAIEHLGARGRMIGVVTHVAELADRLPVRFDVRRGVDGSTVERVAT